MHELASLWIGDKLSNIEQLSALSFIKQGHKLTIYTYEEVKNIPPGVEIKDARKILDTKKIAFNKKFNSPSLHSNIFRFSLLNKTDKVWVDLDILALKKLDIESQYIFGWESESIVNCAVLKLPKDSKTLEHLLKIKVDTVGIPPSFGKLRTLKYRIKTLGRGLPIEKWPWGTAGPKLVTHYLKATGEISHAQPIDTFYSIPSNKIELFTQEKSINTNALNKNIYWIHLWGKELRQHINQQHEGKIPKESFLAEMIRNHSEWADYEIQP